MPPKVKIPKPIPSETGDESGPQIVPKLPAPAFPQFRLPIQPPYLVMEAKSTRLLPGSEGWIFEPKWDGFRCLAFRSGGVIALQSKSGQPLTRYFPELAEELLKVPAESFVLDGEIVVEIAGRLDFDALLQRIHPASSRVRRLSIETPSQFFCFDLLVDAEGNSLADFPLIERKRRLSAFFSHNVKTAELKKTLHLANSTEDRAQAQGWMTELADFGCDGVMAKLKTEPYHSGDCEGMVKVKRLRTADCVVGGFRYAQKKENGVGSLLLGLYNASGELDHIGFCSSFTAIQRKELVKTLEPLVEPPGFTGKAPGGPSRWNQGNDRSSEWQPLKTELVCEVQYDHFSGGRFRHGTKFLHWRPEKAVKSCTFDQLKTAKAPQRRAS